MDREISAIVAKAGLPRLRYLSFANAPMRKRPGADSNSPSAASPVEPADALGQVRPGGVARAETSLGDRAAEPTPSATGLRPPPLHAAPSLAEAGGTPDAAHAGHAAAADFLLLRAVDEQLRRSAAGGRAGGPGQQAGSGGGHGDQRRRPGPSGRPAAPARADFDLAG